MAHKNKYNVCDKCGHMSDAEYFESKKPVSEEWEKRFKKIPSIYIGSHPVGIEAGQYVSRKRIKQFISKQISKAYNKGYAEALHDLILDPGVSVKSSKYIMKLKNKRTKA